MRKRVIIFGIILAMTLGFIWGNSILSREVSGAISHFVADIFGGEQGSTEEGHFLLRKAGHFIEFAFLGVIFQLFVREILKDVLSRALASSLVFHEKGRDLTGLTLKTLAKDHFVSR